MGNARKGETKQEKERERSKKKHGKGDTENRKKKKKKKGSEETNKKCKRQRSVKIRRTGNLLAAFTLHSTTTHYRSDAKNSTETNTRQAGKPICRSGVSTEKYEHQRGSQHCMPGKQPDDPLISRWRVLSKGEKGGETCLQA